MTNIYEKMLTFAIFRTIFYKDILYIICNNGGGRSE